MDMASVLTALKDTPIPTILVIAGIVFLLLSIAGQLAGRIAVAPEQQRWAAIIGGGLLAIGVALHVVPQTRLISRGTEEAPISRPSPPETKDQRPQPSEVSPSMPPSTPESSAQAWTEEKEPNDHIAHATLIPEGTTVRGSIATDEDRDFFKFKDSSTKTQILLRKRPPLRIDIYDHAENRIRSKDSAGDRTSSYSYESSTGFIYYILVKPSKFHAPRSRTIACFPFPRLPPIMYFIAPSGSPTRHWCLNL
jgi:hypothetical protein